MKLQTAKKLFSFIAIIVLSVSALVFYNSCQKEINSDSTKTNDAVKAKSTVSSKIIYTDVIPDSTINCSLVASASCSSFYYLDLNNDGTNDFSIVSSLGIVRIIQWVPPGPVGPSSRTNSTLTVTPLNGNATFDSIKYSGNVIDRSSNWSTALQSMASKSNTYTCVSRPPLGYCNWGPTFIAGSWSGQKDKYLPLRLIVGTNTYYGWARLDVASGGTSFTIKDYAYNSIPNQPILAGQTK